MVVDALDVDAIAALTDMLGGDADSLRELIDAFVEEAPARLAEARIGIDTGDAELAGRAAHTLKSNALTFGATRMAEVARQIETAARTGDLGAAAELLPMLEQAWVNVQPPLSEVLATT
jgi:HPt (histidine-containing phosphotransfer) domain-containing protein